MTTKAEKLGYLIIENATKAVDIIATRATQKGVEGVKWGGKERIPTKFGNQIRERERERREEGEMIRVTRPAHKGGHGLN